MVARFALALLPCVLEPGGDVEARAMRVAGCWVPSDTLWLGAGPRWATVASGWGTDVTVSQPVAVRQRSTRTQLEKKSDATQPGRRARTY